MNDSRERFPRQFPGLRLREILRRSGVGVWFRAHQDRVGRDVLLKVAPSSDSPSGHLLRREVEILGAKRHPGFLTLFDFQDDELGCRAVYELPPGGSLEAAVANSLESGRVIEYGAQLASMLETLHAGGHLLRRADPRDFLIADQDRLRLSSLEGSLLEESRPSVERSPLWLAPPGSGERGDLFLLGLQLVHMLTRRVPVPGDLLASPAAALELVLRHGPRDSTTEALLPVIRRLLGAPRAGGFREVGEARAALEALREGARPGTGRRRTALLVGGALLAGVVLGTGAWMLGPGAVDSPSLPGEGPGVVSRTGPDSTGSSGQPAPAPDPADAPGDPGNSGSEPPPIVAPSPSPGSVPPGASGPGEIARSDEPTGDPDPRDLPEKTGETDPPGDAASGPAPIDLIDSPRPPGPVELFLTRSRARLGRAVSSGEIAELESLQREGITLLESSLEPRDPEGKGGETPGGLLEALVTNLTRLGARIHRERGTGLEFAGEVIEVSEGGRWRLKYDFSSIRQREDWVAVGEKSRLVVAGGRLTLVGEIRFRPDLEFTGAGWISFRPAPGLSGQVRRNHNLVLTSRREGRDTGSLVFGHGLDLGGEPLVTEDGPVLLPAHLVYLRVPPPSLGVAAPPVRLLARLEGGRPAKHLERSRTFRLEWGARTLSWMADRHELFSTSLEGPGARSDESEKSGRQQGSGKGRGPGMPGWSGGRFQVGLDGQGSTLEVDELELELELAPAVLETLAIERARRELLEAVPAARSRVAAGDLPGGTPPDH